VAVRGLDGGKLIQMLLVLVVGAGAFMFANRVPPEALQEWVYAFAPQSDWLKSIADKLASATDQKLTVVGAVGFAYASLFAVEGVGLWLQKTWAEYLTVIVTSSYMPFEIYGLTQEFSASKVVTLVINGAVVVFLIIRIVRERREKNAST